MVNIGEFALAEVEAVPPSSKRPFGVRLMSLFACACGILITALGLSFLGFAGLSTFNPGLSLSGVVATVVGLVFVLLGVSSFVSGLGLYRQNVWAWWLALTAFLVTLGITAASFQIGGVLVNLAGVLLLLAVRKHFGIRIRRPAGV